MTPNAEGIFDQSLIYSSLNIKGLAARCLLDKDVFLIYFYNPDPCACRADIFVYAPKFC